jgi:EmrB/QacA subfamily drug resistance transporter
MRRSTQVLLVTAAAMFLSFLDATIVNVAFPAIRGSFPATSFAGASWVLSAYAVVFAALLIPMGLAGDLLGRRWLFLGGLGLFLAASALCAVAPSIAWLVAARALQAVGGAAIVPSSLGLLLPEFPPERRASATAIWGAAGAVAAATGPTLGGLLVERLDWRWVFLVNVPIGAAAIGFGRRILVYRRPAGAVRRPDLPGAALLVGAIGLLTLGVTQGTPSQWGWGDARTLAGLAGGALALAGFLARSAGRANAIVDLALFRVRRFSAANAGSFAFALAFYALLLANVTFLTSVWNYDVLRAGFAISPSPLMAAVSAPVAGRLCERFGTRAVAVPGVALFAAGCALFAAGTGGAPDYLGSWLPAALVGGVGIGTTFAAFAAAAVADLPPERFASGAAVTQTSRQIGAALGVAAFVAVLGSPEPAVALAAFHRCWWAMTGAAVVASACALALGSAARPLTTTREGAP